MYRKYVERVEDFLQIPSLAEIVVAYAHHIIPKPSFLPLNEGCFTMDISDVTMGHDHTGFSFQKLLDYLNERNFESHKKDLLNLKPFQCIDFVAEESMAEVFMLVPSAYTTIHPTALAWDVNEPHLAE